MAQYARLSIGTSRESFATSLCSKSRMKRVFAAFMRGNPRIQLAIFYVDEIN